MFVLPINFNDKLGLLSDILENQVENHKFTSDEQKQLTLLSNSLLSEPTIAPQLEKALQEIITSKNNETISPGTISHWIEIINQQ